jgi:hypothetical protein
LHFSTDLDRGPSQIVLFEPVEARDLPSYLAVYDPAVVTREASFLPYAGTYHGHEGAKEHGTGFASVWGKFQPADEKRLDPVFLDAGKWVVVLFRLKGLAAESGRKLDVPVGSVQSFRTQCAAVGAQKKASF